MGLINSKQKYYKHNSGLYIPEPEKKPTMIDLFCGMGGFGLGFLQAGFEIVAASDYDEKAATIYMMNLGSYPINIHYIEPSDRERIADYLEKNLRKSKKKKGIYKSMVSGSGWVKSEREAGNYYPPVKNFWLGDIRKLSGKDMLKTLGMEPGEVDCVCGGPPCQGFSTMGKQDVMDPRNSLVFEFARLILEIQPKTFVFENVPGIINMVTPEGLPVLEKFCLILEEGGFGTADVLERVLKKTAEAGLGTKFKPQQVEGDEDVIQQTKPQMSLF